MLSVPGLGVFTLATFFAEVGDLKKYSHQKVNRKHAERPLKKMQSLIALCCKLIRILFVMGTK